MFFPCSLPDQRQCASESELSQFQVIVIRSNPTYDFSEYEHPVKYIIESQDFVNFAPSTSKYDTWHYREVKVFQDHGKLIGKS